ncbi:MAG: Hsp20/alpha crystallin family protein [Bryobacterales bacterium]|nr:Hsp20/alpha crystallin family protein [Bryobacterales bacterium]
MSRKSQNDIAITAINKVPATPAEQVWEPMVLRQGEMTRRFNNFLTGYPLFFGHDPDVEMLRGPDSMFNGTAPAFDLEDLDKEYRITAELPGMSNEDIDVKLANHVLTVKGEKKEKKEEKKVGYFLSERCFGTFQRSFCLTDDIDLDNIGAHFEKGVLSINLPKGNEAVANERKISVKAK